MISRVLEPEAMDSPEEALAYDQMDHRVVNECFVDDLLVLHPLPRRVLDLGAGTGQIPIVLCKRCPEVKVTAVDIAPSMLRRAAFNVARERLTQHVTLVVADVRSLDTRPGDYDLVVSNSLTHHMPDPVSMFRAVARAASDTAAVMVRDLCRPERAAQVDAIVDTYAREESTLARSLFRASLYAALTLDEVRIAAREAGLGDAHVTMTSDRHWTLTRAAQ